LLGLFWQDSDFYGMRQAHVLVPPTRALKLRTRATNATGIWAAKCLWGDSGAIHEPVTIDTPDNNFGPKCGVWMKSKYVDGLQDFGSCSRLIMRLRPN